MTDIAFDNRKNDSDDFLIYPSEPDDPPMTLAAIKPTSPWANPDVCDRLKVLWADHSASEICVVLHAEFGVTVTPLAVWRCRDRRRNFLLWALCARRAFVLPGA